MNRLAILFDILSGRDRKELQRQENVLSEHETRLSVLEHRQQVRDTFRRVTGGKR